LVAAYIFSITGFGFCLIAAPLLLFILEPKSVVIINILMVPVLSVLILLQARRHLNVRRVAFLCIGNILGIFPGTYILLIVEAPTLKLIIASLIILFCILLLLGHSHQFKRENIGSAIFGFISGLLLTSTSLAGPPVVIFYLNQKWEREQFRATLAAYWFFTYIVALGLLGTTGMVTADLLVKALIFLPPLLLGVYLGIKTLPRVNPALFRKIAIFVLVGAALLGIMTSLVQLS